MLAVVLRSALWDAALLRAVPARTTDDGGI